jgi:NTP pyrophosphatase (non-canonical NTP hydrolase)
MAGAFGRRFYFVFFSLPATVVDMSTTDSLAELQKKIRAFARERDWEQFHSPKNLAMALSVEAAELLEHFQWLSEEQSLALPEQTRREAALEMADVLIYLCRLADRLEIDLLASAREKMRLNARKYPVDQARGRADKYTRYTDET